MEEEKVEEEGEWWSEEEPDGDSLEADLAEVLEELGGAGYEFGEEERDEATTTSGATTSSGLDSGNGSTATTSKPTLGKTKIL